MNKYIEKIASKASEAKQEEVIRGAQRGVGMAAAIGGGMLARNAVTSGDVTGRKTRLC